MAPPPLLRLDGVRLTFGGTPLLTGVELNVLPGERIALVGRNGSGKSTLMKIAAGQVEPDGGEVFLKPGTTLRYLPQEPDFGDFKTVGAYVASGLGPAAPRWRVPWPPSRTSCCSTSRPTISTCRPSSGWKTRCAR